MNTKIKNDTQIYALRKKDLLNAIKQEHSSDGIVVLFAGFETERYRFRQESSFYYYTGITEPGVVFTMDMEGKTTLYVPHCQTLRSQWVDSPIALIKENAKELGVDTVEVLGKECSSILFSPYFPAEQYSHMIELFQKTITDKKKIYTLCPHTQHAYIEQRLVLNHLKEFVPELKFSLQDISEVVASMRRKKDMHEIELINNAVDLTMLAHEAAAGSIKAQMLESEVQASIEYVMIAGGGMTAFPSIVATGVNGTTLHYTSNKGILKNGELVVVDIGAELDYYCADLTRTYPVSGTFTARQKEIYQLVLDTQEYIAGLAQPGYWLNNPEKKEKSLHHLALAFLKKHGYEQYMPHGIGHYLGLDVHDVGSYKTPLEEGDVITIEPGIYIKDEGIGIRIEDNYWLVKGGAVCLSEKLPKSINAIEQFAQSSLQDEEDIVSDEYADDELDQFTQH